MPSDGTCVWPQSMQLLQLIDQFLLSLPAGDLAKCSFFPSLSCCDAFIGEEEKAFDHT